MNANMDLRDTQGAEKCFYENTVKYEKTLFSIYEWYII